MSYNLQTYNIDIHILQIDNGLLVDFNHKGLCTYKDFSRNRKVVRKTDKS